MDLFPCLWKTWQHTSTALLCTRSIPPADNAVPLGSQVILCSTLSHWHVLPHTFAVLQDLSYLSFLVHIKSGCGRVIVLVAEGLRNTSPPPHPHPPGFCCLSRNSPVGGVTPPNFRVIESSTHSHWHLLPHSLLVRQHVSSLSFLSLNKTGCAWVTAHVFEGLGNTSFQWLSAVVQGTHQQMAILQ